MRLKSTCQCSSRLQHQVRQPLRAQDGLAHLGDHHAAARHAGLIEAVSGLTHEAIARLIYSEGLGLCCCWVELQDSRTT